MGDTDFQARVLDMLSDIKADVAGVSERVGRVETVQVERCSAQGKRLEAIEAKQQGHDEDIQALKEHRSFTRGQQAALTTVSTVAGAAAGAALSHFLGK